MRTVILGLCCAIGLAFATPALADTTLLSNTLPGGATASLTKATLTYERAMRDVARFQALLEQIPDEERVGIRTQEELDNWTKEIVPYFEYEGIDAETDPGKDSLHGLIYPKVRFEDYRDGLMSHHVLGTTQIFTNEVTLNDRIANPVSVWYGRDDSILTLIHELCHAQGIKFPAPNSVLDQESSAQLCALEVASAMVNNGNKRVLPALLDELVYMNLAAARFLAMAADQQERFYADRARLVTDPFKLATFEKSDRQWANYDDPGKYPYVLYAYNFLPIEKVVTAFAHGDTIYGVRLPINWLVDMGNEPGHDTPPGSYGVEAEQEPVPNHISYPPAPLPLIVDDLHYVYEHADELVAGLTTK
jgi:hypothetical protein